MEKELEVFIKDVQELDLINYSEIETKQAIVQQIFYMLGWNIANINEVKPEFPVTEGFVDYALIIKKSAKVLIEVKKPAENIEKHQMQLLKYAFNKGVELAVLTNGNDWWFYLPLEHEDWEKRKFYAIDIKQQDKKDITGKFISLLSKANIENGIAIENAKEVFKSKRKKEITIETLPEAWKKIINEDDGLLVDYMVETVESISGYPPERKLVVNFIKKQCAEIKEKSKTIKNDIIKKQTEKLKTIEKQGSAALNQILEVLEMIYNKGNNYNEAVKKVAEYRNISTNAVRDKCTRQLNLKTSEFIKATENKSTIKKILISKFHNDSEIINNRIK